MRVCMHAFVLQDELQWSNDPPIRLLLKDSINEKFDWCNIYN